MSGVVSTSSSSAEAQLLVSNLLLHNYEALPASSFQAAGFLRTTMSSLIDTVCGGAAGIKDR